jgi:alpha/beta superfamily hydrolase
MHTVDGGASDDADAPGAVPPPVPSGCISDVSAGSRQVTCDDLVYDLSVPEGCLSVQCGLILDVHGGTMNAKMEDNNTKLAQLGREHGYLVVQPNANNGLFDATTDDAKVFAFAQSAIAVFHLDPKRVHMTGFSQGGYMTWRFICQHTEFLASAAPAAAAGMANISDETDCSFTGTDRPSSELDVLYMHGTQDALVDFQNALVKRDAVTAAFELGAGEMVAGDSTFRRTRYSNARGTIFEFIDHDYVSNSSFPADPPLGIAIEGHCYPGSSDQMPTEPGQLMAFGCVPPNSFNWGESVLAFFMAHRKP